MTKIKSWLICLSIVLSFSFVSFAEAQSNPVGMLQNIAHQMIAKLQANRATLKSNPRLVYSFAYQLVVPRADIAEMSRRVLPPQLWNSANNDTRQRFEREFTKLLVRTYASALAEYKDETINFYPVRGGFEGKRMVKVDSVIVRSEGPSIPVGYVLVNRGSDWKLIDLNVEGVSLLESFRSQFAEAVGSGNLEMLTRQLMSHNTSHGG